MSTAHFALVEYRPTGRQGILGLSCAELDDIPLYVIVFDAEGLLEAVRNDEELPENIVTVIPEDLITMVRPINNLAKKLLHRLLEVSWDSDGILEDEEEDTLPLLGVLDSDSPPAAVEAKP